MSGRKKSGRKRHVPARRKLSDARPEAPRNAASSPVADDAQGAEAQFVGDGLDTTQRIDEISVHGAENNSRAVNTSSPEKLISICDDILHDPTMRNGGTIDQLVQIGRRIRLAREALGLQQIDICRNIGIEPTTWNMWESGKRKADPIAMVRFANAYGVTLDWIYRGAMSGLPHELVNKLVKPDIAIN